MDSNIRRHHIPVVREAEGNMVRALIMIHNFMHFRSPSGSRSDWVRVAVGFNPRTAPSIMKPASRSDA